MSENEFDDLANIEVQRMEEEGEAAAVQVNKVVRQEEDAKEEATAEMQQEEEAQQVNGHLHHDEKEQEQEQEREPNRVEDKEEQEELDKIEEEAEGLDAPKEDPEEVEEPGGSEAENKEEKTSAAGDKFDDLFQDKVDKGDKDKKEEVEKEESKADGDKDDKKEEEEKAPPPCYELDPKDDDYFSSLSQEELEWYTDLGPKPEAVASRKTECTACHRQITNLQGSNLLRHPLLGVAVCRYCRLFYGDGDWETEEDGSDKFCRWCANGGELLCCDGCPKAFCKRCIQRNLGRKFLANISNAEEWMCLACDPRQIYKFRAEYYVLVKFVKNMVKSPEKSAGGRSRGGGAPTVTASTIKALDKAAAENFVDEQIQEALKTLLIYQKSLTKQRDAWAKAKREMQVDKVAPVCKALRKAFVFASKNMELLDLALVEQFKTKFPGEEKKIKIVRPPSISGGEGGGGGGGVKRKAGGGGGGTPGKSPSAKRQRKASGGGAKGASRPIKAKKVKSASKVEINGDTSSDDEDHMKKPLLQQGKLSMSLFGKKTSKTPTTTTTSVDRVDVSDSDSDDDLDLLPFSPSPTKKQESKPKASPPVSTSPKRKTTPSCTKEETTPKPPSKPGPTSSKKPGPASSKKPGPASSKKPGPASSKKPGPASSKKPGPASSKPGPASSKRPGPKSKTT